MKISQVIDICLFARYFTYVLYHFKLLYLKILSLMKKEQVNKNAPLQKLLIIRINN